MTTGLWALLGSGEFEPWSTAVDDWLLARAAGDGRVAVLPTASAPEGDAVFAEWAAKGTAHYRHRGHPVTVLDVRSRADADDPSVLAALGEASLLAVSGGNPAYLAQSLVGTALWQEITDRLQAGMAYLGCSAGMACLGRVAPDSTVDALAPELWQPGLAAFPDAWFGPHWDALDGYVPGFTAWIEQQVPAGDRLVTVDEVTALVGDADGWTVIGAGRARLLADGRRHELRAGDQAPASALLASLG